MKEVDIMKKANGKWILLICACCSILFLCAFIPRYKIVEKISDHMLDRSFSFGLPDGLYDKDITLELATNIPELKDAEIYYTIDGSVPTDESSEYVEPLIFSAEEDLKVIQICAAVYQNGEQIGGIYNGTWLLCSEPEKLEDMLIVSIVADYDDLFGESGILYPAKSYISGNTDEKWNEVHAQNFAQKGEAWIRPVHVKIFEGDGNEVINETCGINIMLLKENVQNRRSQVFAYLKKYFGAEDLYTITLLPSDGLGRVHFNSLHLENEAYTGIYTSEYPVTLEYEDSIIDTIDYWLVNGEKIECEKLMITSDMIQNGTVTVQPVIKTKGKAEALHMLHD